MFRPRVIPCLLLKDKGLVKTIGFKDPIYIGDPINAVRIFNEKEADELIFLDITRSHDHSFLSKVRKHEIAFEMISKISRECLMPLTYGGGVQTIQDVETLFSIGVEKVVVNTSAIQNPDLIAKASDSYGSQSIAVSIDAKCTGTGRYEVFSNGGTRSTGIDPTMLAKSMESMGAGEILINSIDRDGTMSGYDIELVKRVSTGVNIPVIACGGVGKLDDLRQGYEQGCASALAAGSLFVFHGRKKAVLINYPSKEELERLFTL